MLKNDNLKRLGIAAITALLVAGCGTSGGIRDEARDVKPIPVDDIIADLEKEPGVLVVSLPKGAFTLKQPDRLTVDKDIAISFRETQLNVALESIAKTMKLNLLYDKKEAEKYVISINYEGKVAGLFDAISAQTGLFFIDRNGTILVKDKVPFSVALPSYQDLVKDVSASIQNMGGEKVSHDNLSSNMTFTTNRDGLERINEYLQKLRDNAALITMRITLLSVTLTEGHKTGIDWTKMALGYQTYMTNVSTTGKAAGFVTGGKVAFNSTGANLLVDEKRWSIDAFVNLIESYGTSRLLQNISLESLSGSQGKLSSVTKTPYVKSIGATALSTGATTVQQTATTEIAKDGVEMTVQPYYSKEQGTLSMKLKVDVLTVGNFLTLSAGSQLGTLSQPETTEKSIETFLRLKPGQVAIIGGLIISKDIKDSKGLPIVDSYFTKATDTSRRNEELVIVVRPVIVQFVEQI